MQRVRARATPHPLDALRTEGAPGAARAATEHGTLRLDIFTPKLGLDQKEISLPEWERKPDAERPALAPEDGMQDRGSSGGLQKACVTPL